MPGAIVAPQPLAVEEGAKVLQRGGNAVDAAVTCAFVQAIVDPHNCGIGGYALVNGFDARSGSSYGLDAPALSGEKVTAEMWEDRLIRPNPDGWGFFLEEQVNDAGYTSICTPGWVKGMAAILERWGTISWSEAISPAIRIANDGFMVTESLGNRWKRKAAHPEGLAASDYIRRNPEARRVYLKENGETYDMGETVRNPDYAQTLRHLAEHGPEDFYRGTLAARIAADLEANGSYVTGADLRMYGLRENAQVVGSYRGYRITSASAPHGGPTLLAILKILEGFDLASYAHNSPDYIYLVAMAMKAGFADRNPFMADPEFEQVPQDWMISEERAAYWRDQIKSGEDIDVSFSSTEPPHTTHVTVVDATGNAVALTHSLGSSSGVITPGLGFMYNNSMVNFYPIAGNPNSIAPRKGRTTGMAPTVLLKDDRPALVLGSPGATRIITSNLQVILNVVDFGMGIGEAVHAPRFDCQVGAIRCQMRIPQYVCDQVAARHPIVRIPQSHGGFALVHAITVDPTTGQLAGAADTGADGMALIV